MHCRQADNLIDPYMDGELVGELKNALDRHAASCVECRVRIDEERDLRRALAALPVAAPSDGFFERALSTAREDTRPTRDAAPGQSARRRWPLQAGGALAAGFVLWFAAGVVIDAPAFAPEPALPEIVISLEQPTPVNLVFSSVGDLRAARVSLQLPAGVELAGYDGRRQLIWTTDLKDGKNVLTLPLVAHTVPTEEIVARLEHGEETKTFRMKVTITPTTRGTLL